MPSVPARRLSATQRRFVLTPQEARFVEEYLVDLDHRGAAGRVGLPPRRGTALLADPKIQEAISLAKRRRASRTELEGDYVVRRLRMIADADPREIAEIRRVNCRHCHGVDHEYQFNDLEHRHALRDHRARERLLSERDRTPFDDQGGPGFWEDADPSPTCPNCYGNGVLKIFIKDSRHYSEAAALLFDGIKYGAGGSVEVKLRDRSWADGLLAKHAHLFNDRTPIEEFLPGRMTDDQLDTAVTTLVESGVIAFEDVDADVTDLDYVDADADDTSTDE